MEIVILIILVIIMVCLILLIGMLRTQNERQIQMGMTHQETRDRQESEEKMLMNLSNQVVSMRREQAAASQTTDRVYEDIQRMNRVMTNTKSRGSWGEYQLNMLLNVYVGHQKQIYETQYHLANGKIADAALHLPDSSQVLCIDAKFPMENFEKGNEKEFARNVKKHIHDVAEKYITPQTADQALLFIPSEAVYQYICSEATDLLNEALASHVLLTSPTTLVGVLYTLMESTRDFYRAEHMKEIEKNILALLEDADRLCERSEKAEKSLRALTEHFHKVSVSAGKIAGRMHALAEGETDE
ncbi:MAG: DNA recombination protein RmuC [Catenisphaera adipataccumulans]|jgi:DNA recombination protein RmuC|uniref:DNA recombination protein RmuC n=1 Tax=Catenisphaera adipataccumulans TaxID=700500 RepID=UPI003D90E22A